MERRASGPDELPRITTVSRVLRYSATVIVVLVAGMLVLTSLASRSRRSSPPPEWPASPSALAHRA